MRVAFDAPDAFDAFGTGGGDGGDAIERSEIDSAAFVGAERLADLQTEVAMFEQQLQGAAGAWLAAASEQVERVAALVAAEQQMLDLVGAFDFVDRELFGGGQFDFLARAADERFAAQLEADRRQPRRHEEFVRGLAVLMQDDAGHDLRGGDAVVVGRNDRQPDLFQGLERNGRAVDGEAWPDRDLGFAAGDERFAFDIKAGGESEAFGFVIEVVEAGESGPFEHDRPAARVGAERHQDRAVFGRREFAAFQPHLGVLHLPVLLVEHSEAVAVRRDAGDLPQLADAQQRAAAAAVANEIDDVDARLGESGELEAAGHAAQRRVGVVRHAFVVGD